MMETLLKRIRIKTKILSGFGGIIGLLAVIAGIGVWALLAVGGNFSGYRQLARETNAAGRVQANLLETRLASKNFVIAANEKSITTVRERATATLSLIEQMKTLLKKAEHKKIADASAEDIKG
jgi:methyl-accepting chemotaxis protein